MPRNAGSTKSWLIPLGWVSPILSFINLSIPADSGAALF